MQGKVRGMSRHTFFLARSGRMPAFLTLFRLLITSVLRDIGRGRLWSLRNKPHALQSTEPNSSRLQRGVVEVLQLWQVGCEVSRLWLAGVAIMIECRLSKREKDLRKFGGAQGAFMYCGGISSGLIRF